MIIANTYISMNLYVTLLLAHTLLWPTPTKETTNIMPVSMTQIDRRTKKKVLLKPYRHLKQTLESRLMKSRAMPQTSRTV